MQDDRSDLLLFIDLGFILLVGFLVLTDTTPRENVALPAGEEEHQKLDDRLIYEVLFDVNLDFIVTFMQDQTEVCAPSGLETLAECLTSMAGESTGTVFVFLPQGRATVQQLVSLLDLCYRNQWRCTVDS